MLFDFDEPWMGCVEYFVDFVVSSPFLGLFPFGECVGPVLCLVVVRGLVGTATFRDGGWSAVWEDTSSVTEDG